jgi:hypothetical protein
MSTMRGLLQPDIHESLPVFGFHKTLKNFA